MTNTGDALADLFDDVLFEAGSTVRITRGANAPVDIEAIKGRAFTERLGDDQMYGTSLESDFVFRVADYLAIVGSEPGLSDTIEFTDDRSEVRRFRVGVDGTERHYDPVGQFGLVIRVHTTEIT